MSHEAVVKVGQRVRIIREIKDNFYGIKVGEEGEVIHLYKDAFNIPVRVKFDGDIEQQVRYNEIEVIS